MANQHGIKSNNDYVVSGAIARCDCAENLVTFVAPLNRRMEIQSGLVGVMTDTNADNFVGNPGLCKKTQKACVIDPLSNGSVVPCLSSGAWCSAAQNGQRVVLQERDA